MAISDTMTILDSYGVCYNQIQPNHVKIETANGVLNFYPSTEKFNYNGAPSSGKGVYQLLDHLGIDTDNRVVVASKNDNIHISYEEDDIDSLFAHDQHSNVINKETIEKSNNMKIKYKKIDEDAIPPHKSRETDAGIDLPALDDAKWEKHGNQWYVIVRTGIALEVPKGFYLATAPRSSS